MPGKLSGDGKEDGSSAASRDKSRIDRRGYLKLAGIAAASGTGLTVESAVVEAATSGYGEGGYGEGGYGTPGFGITTAAPGSIDTSTATLEGSLDDLGGADSADCYFEWRQVGASNWNATAASTLTTTRSYSDDLTGLVDGVSYEYRAVGEASDGDTGAGSSVSFTTNDDPPAVTTGSPSGVGTSTATLDGNLDDLGGADSADCYFRWRAVGADTWNTSAVQSLTTTGAFSADLSGLNDGVDYEFEAIAEAGDGDTDQGSLVSFTTNDYFPVVSTSSPADLTDSSATLNGSLDDLGGASSVDCYFEWRAVGADTWNTTAGQTLSSPGAFSTSISGLAASTDYEYRAAAAAADGDTDTGGAASFTTDSSNSAPTVESYVVTEAGSPNPHVEITADWSVADDDGNLSSVVVEVIDASGSLVDSATTAVSGSSAAGTDEFFIKKVNGASFDVILTVTDAGSRSASATRSITE